MCIKIIVCNIIVIFWDTGHPDPFGHSIMCMKLVSVRFSEYQLNEEIHFGWHLHAKFYICQCNVSTLRGQKTKFVLPEWFK